MSKTPPERDLSSLTVAQLQAEAQDVGAIADHSPKDWFEQARYAADKAVLAERGRKKEDMFLEYVRACHCYASTKGHPNFPEERKKDPQWAARVNEFREIYDSFLTKAKEVKTVLRKREIETAGGSDNGSEPSSSRPHLPGRQHTGPDVKAGGSIADRMKALQGRGMAVDSSKRTSREIPAGLSVAGSSRTIVSSSSAIGGPRKMTGSTDGPRSRANSTDPTSPSASATSPSKPVRKPIVPPKPQSLESHHPPQPSDTSPSSTPTNMPPPDQPLSRHTSREATGSGEPVTRARRSATSPPPRSSSTDRWQTPTTPQRQLHPSHSGPTTSRLPPSSPAAHNSPSIRSQHLASIPSSPAKGSPRTPAATQNGDTEEKLPSGETPRQLEDFEKAFPSLAEFGKQFGDDDEKVDPNLPPIFEQDPDPPRRRSVVSIPKPSGPRDLKKVTSKPDEQPEITLPDVPKFPDIPSAPTHRLDLPPPPSRPTDLASPPLEPPDISSLRISTKLRPPSPTVGSEIQRPASTPNVATLMDNEDAMFPTIPTETKRPGPPPMPAALRRDRSDKSEPEEARSPALSPPMEPDSSKQASVPLPGPSQRPRPHHTKPKFPLTNSIDPDTIRTYLLNPAVDLLFLDVRPEEETKKGHVGQEYEERGAKVPVVWIDPTILFRDGINSTKLEDALSLSSETQQKAFEKRNKYDLVVVYDAKSPTWPRKDPTGPPAPLSRLWEIIYEHEFTKKLERTPVLLNGGYETWLEFIKGRAAKHAADHARALAYAQNGTRSPGRMPNGHRDDRPASGDAANKRANRDMPVYQSSHYAKNITESFGYGPQSMIGDSSYPHPSRSYITSPPIAPSRPTHSPSHSLSSYSATSPTIAPPPQASIRPGPGSRRRSEYVEQQNQPYTGFTSSPRGSVDYPQAHALTRVPQPPPAAQSPSFERYDTRPAVVRSGSIRGLDLVAREGDEVRYWNDVVLGLTGLKNLGNTCYMNSTIQCLSATFPFTSYFLDGSYKKSINVVNPLGTKGALARAFSELLKALWKEDYTFLSPVTFRKNIISFASQFSGTEQHDSQEFLSFVLDGLHEDLNRIVNKPPPVEMTPEREALLETLPTEIASEKEWQIYRRRDDSFIVDLFQGQYRNRLECLTCHKTSTTYDTFMYLSLPVPTNKKRVVLQELIDEFVSAEIMEKEDAWNCPRCKTLRRASKTLTLCRLPPVLLIQLKRFYTSDGIFWSKSETPVIFPVQELDLTRYVPVRHATGKEDLDDPRNQLGPFKYALYGVSNHMGTLSSGHYTAFVKSSKGWQYCEDNRITRAREEDVVTRPAYILFYKRLRA